MHVTWSPARMPAFATLVCALTVLVAGCGPGAEVSLWEEPREPFRREVLETAWDTLWVVGGTLEDTVLQLPRQVHSTGDAVYVLDDGDQRILAFSRDGHPLWSFGGRGGGPDEFGALRDLKVGPDGSLFALDPKNARITVLSPEGEVVLRVPLRGIPHAEQFAPLGDGRFALVTSGAEQPIYVIDGEGTVIDREDLPWEGFARLPFLARQGFVASDGNAWAYLFGIGNGWFSFDGTDALAHTGRFVEHTRFPRIETRSGSGVRSERLVRPSCSACSVAMRDGVVYVLFGGSGPDRMKLVDTYRWSDGEYLGTVRLPTGAAALGVGEDVLYVLRNNPFPTLLALRPRPASDGAALAFGN